MTVWPQESRCDSVRGGVKALNLHESPCQSHMEAITSYIRGVGSGQLVADVGVLMKKYGGRGEETERGGRRVKMRGAGF